MARPWNSVEFMPQDGAYTGSATISFCAPDGDVSGPATVTLTPDGHVTLAVTIQQYAIPSEYHDFLFPFLHGEVPTPIATGGTTFRNPGTQKITKLEVNTSSGMFRARRAFISKWHLSMSTNEGASIEVVPNDLEFVPIEANPEETWCIPLFGNLSEFSGAETACSLVDRVPYIAFKADGAECGLRISVTTSSAPYDNFAGMAFGSIGAQPHHAADEVKDLLPGGLIAALSFATGSDIRAPWVELRSFDGRLGRRLHLRLGGNPQKDGFPAFTGFDSTNPASGIGAFLNCLFRLPKNERDSLIVPMNLVRSGTPGSATVDESITALVKMLDGICKRHGLARRNLRAGLDPQESTEVDQVLNQARERLKRLRRHWKTEQKLDQLAILDRIIGRQANVACEDLDFGIAVADLLHKFGLFDGDAMNSYYSKLPNDVTWESLLSSIRGEVIHTGAIHVQNLGGLLSWFQFARHLHDVCKRIILREIGYTGTYLPSNVLYKGPFDVDRVKPSSTIGELGYTDPPVSI